MVTTSPVLTDVVAERRKAATLPYTPLHYDDGVTWLSCPRCRERIDIREVKDINSYSFVEYETHYFGRHATDDGLVQCDGAWYVPLEDPRTPGKGW